MFHLTSYLVCFNTFDTSRSLGLVVTQVNISVRCSNISLNIVYQKKPLWSFEKILKLGHGLYLPTYTILFYNYMGRAYNRGLVDNNSQNMAHVIVSFGTRL